MAVFEVWVAVGGTPARCVRVQASALVLGRSRDCHVQLPSAAVSGAHLRVVARDPGLWVEDLGSANGTRVADRRLAPGLPEPLAPDQDVRVGPYRVRVRLADLGDAEASRPLTRWEDGPSSPAPGAQAASPGQAHGPGSGTATLALGLVRDLLSAEALPPATLRVQPPTGPERLFHLSVGQRARIGRDPSCALCVQDPDLSREHAEVWLHEEGVSVRDLDSKNGVLQGQAPIRGVVAWSDGEALRFGGTTVRLQDPAQAWLRDLEAGEASEGEPRDGADDERSPGQEAPDPGDAHEEEARAQPIEQARSDSSPAADPAGAGAEPDRAEPDRPKPDRAKGKPGGHRRGAVSGPGLGIGVAIGLVVLLMAAAAWGLVQLLG